MEEKERIERKIKKLEKEMQSLEEGKKALAEQLAKVQNNKKVLPVEEVCGLVERSKKRESMLSVDWNSAGDFDHCYFPTNEEKFPDENTEPNVTKEEGQKREEKISKWPLDKLKEEMKRFGMKTGTKVGSIISNRNL